MEAPETAGTALKTVIARFSEVKDLYTKGQLTGEDSEGEVVDVNKVSKALGTAGIDMSKYFTGEVGLDTIFMQLAEKWDSLDLVQQRYIATQAAGSRQQSRFIAMLSDYGRTLELVEGAENANGASAQQFEKTQESLQTKLNRLKDTWQEFSMGLANNQVIKGAVDALTKLLEIINKLTQGAGDFSSTFLKMGTLIAGFKGASNLFNKGIGKFAAKFGAGMKEGTGEEIAGQIAQPKTFLGRMKERTQNFVAANQTKETARGFGAFRTSAEMQQYNQTILAKKNERREALGIEKKPELKNSGEIAAIEAENQAKEKSVIINQQDAQSETADSDAKQQNAAAAQAAATMAQQEAAQKQAAATVAQQQVVTTEELIAEKQREIAGITEAIEQNNAEIVTKMHKTTATEAEAAAIETEVTGLAAEAETLKASLTARQEELTILEASLPEKQAAATTAQLEAKGAAETAAALQAQAGAAGEAAAGDAAVTGGNMAVKTSADTATVSVGRMGTALMAAFAPILPVIIAVAAAAALVGSAYAAFYFSDSQKHKRFLEGLDQGINGLNDSINDINSSVKELRDNFDDLNTDNFLDGAIKGTDEWNSKILEHNVMVSDLLDKYGHLGLTGEFDTEGVLKLTNLKEVVNKLEEQQKLNLERQNISRIVQQSYEAKSRRKTEEEDITEDLINLLPMGQFVDSTTKAFSGETTRESNNFGQALWNTFKMPLDLAWKYVKGLFDIGSGKWEERVEVQGPEVIEKAQTFMSGIEQRKEIDRLQTSNQLSNQFQKNQYLNKNTADFTALKITDENLYEEYYNEARQLKSTDVIYQDIARSLGYRVGSKGTIFDSEGKEIDKDDKEFSSAIYAAYAADRITERGEEIAKGFSSGSKKVAEKVKTKISNEIDDYSLQETISGVLAENYAVDLNEIDFDSLSNLKFDDETVKEFGVESSDELLNLLKERAKKISEYQETLSNKGLGYFAFNNEGFNAYEEVSSNRLLAMDQFKNLDAAGRDQIVSQFEKLNEYGKPELLEAYKRAMDDIAGAGGKIEDLKFNNLIEFNAQAEKLSGNTENYVETIDMFHELGSSGVLDDVNEQLDDFIEKNGQITSDNIKDLAKQYPILSDYINSASDETTTLDQVTVGLAHTLTYLKQSGKSYADITKNILAASSATRTLNDITAEMSDFVDNFSEGTSNYKGMDFFYENIESIQDIVSKGRYGDQQLQNYLGAMYSDEYLEANNDTNAQVQKLINGYNKYSSYGGLNILKELIATNGDMNELFRVNGTNINVSDKAKDMSVEEIYELFANTNAKNGNKFSKGAIDSALSAFMSTNAELREAWTNNSAEKAVDKMFVDAAKDEKNKNGIIISENEIESIAGITGATTEKVRELIEAGGSGISAAFVPEFKDENSKDLTGQDYVDAVLGRKIPSINTDLKEYTAYARVMDAKGAVDEDSLYHRFVKSYNTDGTIQDVEIGTFDIDAIDEFISHLDAASQSKFWDELETANPNQEYTKNYSYIDEEGKQQHGSVTGKSKEEAMLLYENKQKELDYAKMGQQIANAFKDVKINIDSSETNQATENIEKLKTALNSLFGEGKNNTYASEIRITDNAKNVESKVNDLATAIGNLPDVKNITITETTVKTEAKATGQNNHSPKNYKLSFINPIPKNNAKSIIPGMASGTKNGPVKHKNETVLTGEVGPELIQYADGGAYLTGSNGPEMTQISPDDIVYTADQTKKIFANGGLTINRAENGIGNSFKRYQWTPVNFGGNQNYTGDATVTDDEDKTEVDVEVNITLEDLQTYNSALENDSSATFFQDAGTELLSRGVAPFDTGMSIGESVLVGDYVGAYHTLQGYQQQLQTQDPVATVDQIIEAIKNGTSSIHDAVIDLKDDGQLKDSTLRNLPGSVTMANSNLDNLSMEKTSEILKTHQEDYNKQLEISNKRLDRLKAVESKLNKSQTATLAVQTLETAEMGKQLVTLKKQFDETNAIYQKKKEEFNNGKYGKYFQADSIGNITKTEAGKKADPKMLAGLQEEGDFKAFSAIAGMQGDAFSALFTGGLDFIGGIQSMFDTGKGIFDTMKGYAEKIAQYITQAIEVVVSAWTNRKDWLYNFLNRIEKELHEFAKLQEYANQIDEGRVVSYQELMQNWDDQFESLQKQLEMQNERVESRQQYLDWSKFIPFTLISGWSPVTDTLYENRTVKMMWNIMIGLGKMLPMFGDVFGSLDELYQDYDKRVQENYEDRLEAEKAILEIESERLKLVKAGAEEATQFEEKVMDAFIQKEQEAIDELSRLNESITGANQTLIDTLKDNLEQVRRIRENTDKEEDLTDKEQRLAYLRQDTSNANLNEIKKLEKDLEDEHESYTDKLIDQRIDDLSKQNEDAAAQRQKQIELLQGQLDWAQKYGIYWDHIYGMLYTVDEYGNIGLNQENFDERGFLRANGELSKMLNTFSDLIGESIWKTLMDNEDLKKLGVYYNAFIQYNGNEGIWRRQDMLQNPDINDDGYVSWWADKNAGPFWQFFAKIEDDWHDFWMNNDLGLWNDTALDLKKVADFFLKIWGWITGQSFESRADAWIKEGGFKPEHDNTPITEFFFRATRGMLFNRAANGTDNATAGKWLVGEEGPELIQFKNGGAYLAGTRGPEMVPLSNGDKVYNNSDTKNIFGGPSFGRLASGNAEPVFVNPSWIEDLVERGIKQIGNLTKVKAENDRNIVNEVHINIDNMSGKEEDAEYVAQVVLEKLDEASRYRSTNYIDHPMR